MTRDVLIKLIAQEHEALEPVDDFGWECGCGAEIHSWGDWAEHVADLILLGFAT
jgi:hypothetical protein